ncbi:MAG: hypothetical protein A3E87_03025 [Gammaproteobacteria bacterium RIFCSPHIGHO2_12_FULL_35_23]|nr:MAG: hypothetical protein A3E87_03025 [Gammaproteobacteria bacterium RIFCSPHIGHO2_12_FULL_35_23]
MANQQYTVMIAGMAQRGMEDYVERYLKQMMEHSRRDPGCLFYNIHRSITEPREFMLYSVWENKAVFDQHNQKPEMIEFKKHLAQAMFDLQSPKTYWTMID